MEPLRVGSQWKEVRLLGANQWREYWDPGSSLPLFHFPGDMRWTDFPTTYFCNGVLSHCRLKAMEPRHLKLWAQINFYSLNVHLKYFVTVTKNWLICHHSGKDPLPRKSLSSPPIIIWISSVNSPSSNQHKGKSCRVVMWSELVLNLTGPNWRWQEMPKRHRINR
jgi:hypothetical protein